LLEEEPFNSTTMNHHQVNESCESIQPLSASLSAIQLRRNSSDSSSAASTSRRDTRSSRITFSTVKVHHHDLICGDNPSVSDGVPLQLDWNKNNSQTYDIDAYEKITAADKQVRRLSALERATIAGENRSKSFLEQVEEEVLSIQNSRHLSIKSTKLNSSLNATSRRKRSEAVSPSVLTARSTEYTNWF
jgi:hypothetical protein